MVQAMGFTIFGLIVGIYSSTFGLGGGLLVVPLMVALGTDIRVASATSLVVIIPTAISGVFRELPDQRVEWGIAIMLAAGAILGVFIGIPLKNSLASQTLQRAFAVLLVCVALDMMQLQVRGVDLTLQNLLRKLIG